MWLNRGQLYDLGLDSRRRGTGDHGSLAVGWVGRIELPRQVGGRYDVVGGWVVSLRDFGTEDVAGAEHVAGKDDEFLVGREAHVGFLAVVVVGHIDQALGVEDSGLPEVGGVQRAGVALDQLGMEELDPLAVGGAGHLAGIAAVAGEEREVLGEVEVNRPLVALHVVGDTLAGLEVATGEEEVFALGILPVVPDGLAVEAPELVARDL